MSQSVKLRGGFQFSRVGKDKLEASDYTLATIVVDVTGSVNEFADDLQNMLKTIATMLKKAPTAENIMLRVVLFSSGRVDEVHGFKLMIDIDPDNDYPDLSPYGSTNLYDATGASLEATKVEAERLWDDDYGVNGIVFIITDGDDNDSQTYKTPRAVADLMRTLLKGEKIESFQSILVGLKDPKITGPDWADQVSKRLEYFQKEGEITHYRDLGDATEAVLQKLALDISQMTSSTSQNLGTGATSQMVF